MPSQLRKLWNRLLRRASAHNGEEHERAAEKRLGSSARTRRRFLFEPLEDRRVMAVTFIDPNPAPNNQFGHSVVALSTGNVVVTSPFDDAGGLNAGAVYLFNGATGDLISTLRGSNDFDVIGREGITALASGNFVINSSSWHIGLNAVGAVTFGNGTTGVNGVVSAANSLIGSSAGDAVGATGSVVALPNGNYVALTSSWDNGSNTDVGAITWGSGTTGVLGTIGSGNSLIGTTTGDRIGSNGAKVLSNGSYVVMSTFWSSSAGAVTWASGSVALTGTVSATNSLVGSTANDEVGGRGILQLTNGNYVVMSPNWDNGGIQNVGAATWVNGTTGLSGTLSAANSLVGSSANDNVGAGTNAALTNGNYVLSVPDFDGGLSDAGAAVFGNGTSGVKGTISTANALVGARSNDKVSVSGVVALTNGNYVVNSPGVSLGTNNSVGAVTWGNGTSGVTGNPSSSNSLVGAGSNDFVGFQGITALSNGNYVVASAYWDNGVAADAGAVTWGNGSTGTSGVVSTSNSTYGSRSNDLVGYAGAVALASNGNYIFGSAAWSNGVAAVGAVTWRTGSTASSGAVSASNSLVGSTAGDHLGDIGSMKALPNGNYVVLSSDWDNTGAADAGAVTWASGTAGIAGTINATNSLVGTTANDKVGNNGIVTLTNNNFVVVSTSWNNGAATSAGAVTWVNGASGRAGAVSATNSLVGSSTGDQVGQNGITPLSNGNYVVSSASYDSGALQNAGAVSWAIGTTGLTGVINAPTANHTKGLAAATGLKSISLDATNGTFYARFIDEGSGTIRVGSQSAGFDFPVAGTLTAAFSGPNLTIADADSTGKDNTLTVSRVNVSGVDYYQFVDPVEGFTTAPITSPPSVVTNNNHTLRVPASVITGSLTISLLGGNDSLILDLTTGDVVPNGNLFYNGGAPTSGTADKLTIVGGVQGNVTYNHLSASDGNIALANFGTINYTGLEQPMVNSGTITDLVVNLPTASTNPVVFSEDTANGNGRSRMSGTTILTSDFPTPAGVMTVNYGTTSDTLTFNQMPDFNAGIVLGTAVFPFAGVTFAGSLTLAANKNIAAFASGTINLSTTNSKLTLSGTGTMLLSTARDINMVSGSTITTASGSLTLEANQQPIATTGNFSGVQLNNAKLVSASGAVSVRGRGGSDVAGLQYGVRVLSGAEIGTGTTGLVTVQGTGGASSGNSNNGVQVSGVSSLITSGGGNVVVTGTGGGTGSSTDNTGVSVEGRGVITAGSAGTVSVTGSGSANASGANAGVVVSSSGSAITSNGGAVSVTGTATGGGTLAPGVYVNTAGNILAGGAGNVTVNGTSNGTGSSSHGVYVTGASSIISSSAGNVSVTGTGGGATTATTNYGVFVETGAAINSGTGGSVTINGTGRNLSGTGNSNHGVVISGTGAKVTSGGGNISITGTGGGGSTSTGDSGVRLQSGATISSLAAAAISITGTGGTSTSSGNSPGVLIMDSGTQLNAGTGGLTIQGTPGPNTPSMGVDFGANAAVSVATGGLVDVIADRIRITSTVTAASSTIILRQKTAGKQIDIGGSDTTTALGLDDAELDRLTANLVQIGNSASGNISAGSSAITSPNNIYLKTGGELSVGAFAMALDKNFTADVAGTVRVSSINSNLNTSGTGTINITTPQNIIINGGQISTGSGNLVLNANQQAVSTAASFNGVDINGRLQSGSGEIVVNGRAGAQGGIGVSLFTSSSSASIGSAGAIRLNGTGGGSGTSAGNYGVNLQGTVTVGAGGAFINGQGGNTTGSGANNHGVVFGSGAVLTGNSTVTGRGGGGTGGNNYGVVSTSAPNVGNLTAIGYGGGLLGGGNNNYGVSLGTLIGGNISLTGTGGGALGSMQNHGINIQSGFDATSVTLSGFGGNLTGTGGSNAGVAVYGETGLKTSGNLSITGVGGGGPATGSNTGVSLAPLWIRVTGTGSVNVNGTGGAAGASFSSGVLISVMPDTIYGMEVASGSINVTAVADASNPAPLKIFDSSRIKATGANGGLTLTANGVQIDSGVTISAGSNAVTIKPATAGTPINLGAADAAGLLALTDAKLDTITAGTLNIGDNASGAMTVGQAITRAAATNMSLNSGGNITFNGGSLSTANGNVLLNPNSLLTPATTGVDINAGTGTVSFGSGDDLSVNITGLIADTQYQQLNVVGAVNLSGADLTTTGNLVVSGGEVITIINNDGTDAVVGTFNGLPQGASLGANFLNSGLSASISYTGGTGNDVVIIIGNPPGTTMVDVTDGNMLITDVLGGDTDDTLTLTRNGANIRVTDPNHILAAQGGAIFVDIHTIDVPIALVTGGLVIDTLGGNDSVTLNFSGGNFIPAGGVQYSGGAGNNDSLSLTGGTTSSIDHLISDASSGSITLGGTLAGTISFTGVEPIFDGMLVANRNFFLNGGSETITVTDAAGAFNTLTSTFGHAITFANPTASLMIDAASGDDTISFNSLDAEGPFNAALTVVGGVGNDTVNLNADITFAPNVNLDLDLQNDDATPGTDSINIGVNANLILSGSGAATLKASRNVLLFPGSSVVTANGPLLVEGNQQATASTGDFSGVEVNGGMLQATGTGLVTVRGRGGNGNAGLQMGVLVSNGGAIRGGTTGGTFVQGVGGASTANDNHGVRVIGAGSIITSQGANVQVVGSGGGAGAATTGNRGVDVESNGPSAAAITAGGAGNVVVQGTAANTRNSAGVRVAGVNGLITSTTGTVQVTGQGGNGATSGAYGVWVDRGTITSGTGGGSVTVSGLGGTSPDGLNYGVLVESAEAVTGKITSGGGAVQVLGTGGNGAAGWNVGVLVAAGGEIIAPTLNPLTITGTGGQGTTGANIGVLIQGRVSSSDKNATIIGTGGEGTTSTGIRIDQATIMVGSTSVLRLQGAATTGALALVIGDPSTTTAISHTGTGRIDIAADSVAIASTATITATLGSVTFVGTSAGRAINLGSTADTSTNTLELSDPELDRISAGTLQIGDANAGPITFSTPITRAAATIVNVDSAGAINFTGGSLSSGGGNVHLNAGTNLVPTTAGLDVSAGPNGIVSFGTGDRLTLNIGGPTVDSQYNQLNIAGQVDLTGLQLVLSGTMPQLGEGFIVVSNDGTDAVIGTFDGLPEGTMVDVNGLAKRLTYIGGDGNDVVLLAGNSSPTIDALPNLSINEDSLQQSVSLTGISAGIEVQSLQVTAVSNLPSLIPNPTVTYTSPNATGTLQFTPVADAVGTATITITVRDAGNDGFFFNADDAITTTTFQVIVNQVNDRPTFNTLGDQGVVFNSPAQTVTGWANSISPGPSNESTQTVSFNVTDNSNPGLFQVAPAVASDGTLTYTPAPGMSGSSTITVVAQDSGGTALGGLDTSLPKTFVITVGPELTLRVVSVSMTSTGFVAEFNRQLQASALSLYDMQGSPFGAPDVVLQRVGSPLPVRGSLVLDPTLKKLTFIATSGVLPDGDYNLTLRAATNGIVDTLGTVLDGNGDSVPGGDYTQSFNVSQSGPVVISIPNFARGPRQSVNLPATASTGIPISFSDGGGIVSASFQILFDPTLITFGDPTVAPGLPVGSSVSAFSFEAGVLEVIFNSPEPLAPGTTRFIDLPASIPATAPYGTKQILDIRNITLSDNRQAIDDDGVAVTAFFADVTGNGGYTGQDASLIARLAVGIDTGLEKYKMLDPYIIADITGNGDITAQDTSLMLQAAVNIPVAQIPSPLPTGSLVSGGPDPKLSISQSLTATPGQDLSIPVDIDSIVNLTGNGLASGDLVIYYDPAVLDVSDVALGSLVANRGGWMISAKIDPLAGRIDISLSGTRPLEGKFRGEFVQVHATVRENAPAGAMAINLAANSRFRQTQLNEGFLTLIPAPTDAANDPIDGVLTITAPPVAPTAQVIDGRLLITGTTADDRVFVRPSADGSQLLVRLNNRLQTFDMPSAIAIDALSGNDLVYVDPRSPATLIATVGNDERPEDQIFTGDNAELIDSRSIPAGLTSGNQQPSANDLAIMHLLDQWTADHEAGALNGGTLRRRR
ncbi:hypothetical protein [Anatilimnocola floriformis]|uniref:hypothetical protein n=1 Tax=Anatilimnocola floriformis TaxID=2948575 RepID=UPI0020C34FF4|nr:hypothetical protein [Anatilimnocola floriformis]